MAAPIFRPPEGAVNCHAHVIGPALRFPLDPNSPFPCPAAPAEDLFAMQDELGFDRLVIVQSLAHGPDHAAAADAISRRPETTRGVALAARDATPADYRALAEQGFVAARIHMLAKLPGRLSPDDMVQAARCAAEVGWHIESHCSGVQLEQMLGRLPALPCRAVIDHMAYPAPTLHESVLRAIENPNVYAKISAPERVNESDYRIGAAAALRLIEKAPEKLVWGNDWPHVGLDHVDEGQLMGLLARYPQDAVRQILVDTPGALYF